MNEEYKLNPMRLSDNLPSDWLDNLHNQIVALQKENDALRKQLEESNAKLEYVLTVIYAKDCNLLEEFSASCAVAQICDEELDKSGALLGRIRDRAYALALERDDEK
jgi:hypothetical protein